MLTDIQGMERALELARKGQGFVSPNPMVGCVIVADGRIIGEGFHKKFGGNHAEVEALNAVVEADKVLLRNATVYVNLETCSLYGKTPACANTLIDAGVKKVVVGMIDPNPKVSGNGVALLREAGIQVVVGVMEEECQWLNRAFVKFITTGMPYVILKSGQTIDGCIATMHGQSKWITSEESMHRAHELRAFCDAILVGQTTVFKDDPQLTVRYVTGRNPRRVVLDSELSVPLKARIFMASDRTNTTVFCQRDASTKKKYEALKVAGIQVIEVSKTADHKLNLHQVLEELAGRNTTSILIEGGARVHSSFLQEGLVDEIQLFIAPLVIGNGLHSFVGLNTPSLQRAKRFKYHSIEQAEHDMHIIMVPTDEEE